jgi:hypothetical protein
MSESTTFTQTGNQAHFGYDVTKIFVWNNRYASGSLLNSSGGAKEFFAGTLLGRIAATGKLVPCDATATDGSQFPVGILKTYASLANAAEANVDYCIMGDVEGSKLIFVGSQTLDSVVTVKDGQSPTPADTTYTKRLRDLIAAIGIIITTATELTDYDNQ